MYRKLLYLVMALLLGAATVAGPACVQVGGEDKGEEAPIIDIGGDDDDGAYD